MLIAPKSPKAHFLQCGLHPMKVSSEIPVREQCNPALQPYVAFSREPGVDRDENEIGRAIDSLMDQWCQRRALRPLQVILRSYPGPLWHAYHKMELLETLEELMEIYHDELTPDELRIIVSLLDVLRRRLTPGAV